MIQVKKGTAHSMAQSDRVGPVVANEGVVAGMLVIYDTTANTATGGIKKATSTNVGGGAALGTVLCGFALRNQSDGDVVESGKLGFYQLDGNSVIGTDQYTNTSVSTSDIGKRVVTSATAGKVTVIDATATFATGVRIVGIVDNVRSVPSVTVPATQGTTPGWENATVVDIKLLASTAQTV